MGVSEQLQLLSAVSELPAETVTPDQLETVFRAAARPDSDEVQLRAAILLSRLYPILAPKNPQFARRTHTILLRDLRQPRKTLAHPSCSWLVMTHLREENLAHIPWQSTEEVASACECFYGFCDGGLTTEESHRRVRDLVKYAGVHFAQKGRWEEVFRLLSRVPVPASLMDADLFWLRNTVALYEQRRIQRVRRSLFVLLGAVVLFILFFSPSFFLAFENPNRILQGQPEWTPFEALYWSTITAATVGYGDIAPMTIPGRILAICDSFLGIMVMGVTAGLILSWVTPRPLP